MSQRSQRFHHFSSVKLIIHAVRMVDQEVANVCGKSTLSQRSNKAVKHTKIDMPGRVVYLDLLHVEQVLHNLEDEGIAITK